MCSSDLQERIGEREDRRGQERTGERFWGLELGWWSWGWERSGQIGDMVKISCGGREMERKSSPS